MAAVLYTGRCTWVLMAGPLRGGFAKALSAFGVFAWVSLLTMRSFLQTYADIFMAHRVPCTVLWQNDDEGFGVGGSDWERYRPGLGSSRQLQSLHKPNLVLNRLHKQSSRCTSCAAQRMVMALSCTVMLETLIVIFSWNSFGKAVVSVVLWAMGVACGHASLSQISQKRGIDAAECPCTTHISDIPSSPLRPAEMRRRAQAGFYCRMATVDLSLSDAPMLGSV